MQWASVTSSYCSWVWLCPPLSGIPWNYKPTSLLGVYDVSPVWLKIWLKSLCSIPFKNIFRQNERPKGVAEGLAEGRWAWRVRGWQCETLNVVPFPDGEMPACALDWLEPLEGGVNLMYFSLSYCIWMLLFPFVFIHQAAFRVVHAGQTWEHGVSRWTVWPATLKSPNFCFIWPFLHLIFPP